MSHWDFGRGPAEQNDEAFPASGDSPYGPGEVTYRRDDQDWAELTGGADDAGDAGDAGDLDDEGFGLYPITYERDRIEPDRSAFEAADAPSHDNDPYDPYDPYEIWPSAPVPDDLFAAGERQADQKPWPPQPRPSSSRPDRRWPDRRWLVVAGVALAATATIGGGTVLLTGGHPGRAATPPATFAASPAPSVQAASQTAAAPPASATAAPPLSLAQAQAVLAGYTTANNHANAERSDQVLATTETGSSLAIDVALYRTQRAAGTAPYPAYAPASATYYIPRAEPAGPRWFVAEVGNAFARSPKKVSSLEYLLFLQATPGARWLEAIEPYLLPAASAPRIAVGPDGLATAVASTATSLAAAPVQLPQVTASAFDGSGSLAIPAGVADRADQRSWQGKAPTLTITDRHAPATAGQAFALRTTDGGALVFYTVAATLTITPPAGSVFRLNVPGFYSTAQSLRRAVLQYRDQFAADDPPAGSGPPRIIADYSGIKRRI